MEQQYTLVGTTTTTRTTSGTATYLIFNFKNNTKETGIIELKYRPRSSKQLFSQILDNIFPNYKITDLQKVKTKGAPDFFLQNKEDEKDQFALEVKLNQDGLKLEQLINLADNNSKALFIRYDGQMEQKENLYLILELFYKDFSEVGLGIQSIMKLLKEELHVNTVSSQIKILNNIEFIKLKYSHIGRQRSEKTYQITESGALAWETHSNDKH